MGEANRLATIGIAFAAFMAGRYRAVAFTVLDGIVTGAVTAVDRYIAVWKGGFDALVAIWGRLPDVIGDFAFRAANGLIAGVEATDAPRFWRANGKARCW